MKKIMLVFGMLVMAGCGFSKPIDDGYEARQIIFIHDMTETEINTLATRLESRLCATNEGVFKMHGRITW